MKHHLLGAAGNIVTSSKSMCWTTPQGWMLLLTENQQDHVDPAAAAAAVSSSSACLWNPRTGDKLPLPDIIREAEDPQFPPQSCRCLLSHKDPACAGCVVVLLHPSKPDLWYCQIAEADDDDDETSTWSWTHYSYDVGKYGLPEAYCPPTKKVISTVVAFHGRLYFINSVKDMCAIDFASNLHHQQQQLPAFHYFDAPMVPWPNGMGIGATWLVDCDDQLFLVHLFYNGFDPHDIGAIHVYKMDFLSTHKARWRRIHDIGDVVFLLEDTGLAMSCPASLHGLKGNRIYFMKNVVVDDADLCIFDLESECQEVTRVHKHCNLLLCRKPFWIVLPHQAN